MRYVLVELDFYSPYISTPFFAEQGAGPPLPPPLTLVGALSAAYHYPEEVRGIPPYILKSVKYVSFWAPPYATVVNTSRHFSGLSQRKQRLKVLAAAESLVKGGSTERILRDIVDHSGRYEYKRGEKEKAMRVARMEIERYGPHEVAKSITQVLLQPSALNETYFYAQSGPSDRAYVLYVLDGELEAQLARLAGEIYRVGQKEVLVAPTLLDVRVERLRRDVVYTRFYAPTRALADRANCRTVYMVQVPIDSYVVDVGNPFDAVEEYCVPGPSGHMTATVKKGWVGVKIVAENGAELEAVVPEYAAP